MDNKYTEEIMIEKQYPTFNQYINKNSSDKNLLMFHGSYYNGGRSKFISYPFQTFTEIHNYYNVCNYDYYINILQPDIIIFSSTDYANHTEHFSIDMLENANFPEPTNNITAKQEIIENSHWITNKSIATLTLNSILQTTLKFNQEIFSPDKVWIYLDNSKNEYSTRIEKIENNEAYIDIVLATADILKSNSQYLNVIAENQTGERIIQSIPIKLID